jgi:hypothetical protein
VFTERLGDAETAIKTIEYFNLRRRELTQKNSKFKLYEVILYTKITRLNTSIKRKYMLRKQVLKYPMERS